MGKEAKELRDLHEEEKEETITECPHCGSTYGFYRKLSFSGTGIYIYNWNGTSGDNTNLHDPVHYNENKTTYCCECHKPVKL